MAHATNQEKKPIESPLRNPPTPCFGAPPGIAQAPSIPLPPPPSRALVSTSQIAETYTREREALGTKPKTPSGVSPSGYDNRRTGSGGDDATNPGGGGAPSGSGGPGGDPTGGGGGGPLGGTPPNGNLRQHHHHHHREPHHNRQEEQVNPEDNQEHRQVA